MILQAHYTKLQPEPCINESICIKGSKAFMMYISLCFLAIGAGGIRGSAPALGADQFDQKNPRERQYLARFFNWFLLSITIGASIGVTVVVWVSTNKGWDKGAIIAIVCSFVGLIVIAAGKPFYRVRIPGDSPLSRVLQVFCLSRTNYRESLLIIVTFRFWWSC